MTAPAIPASCTSVHDGPLERPSHVRASPPQRVGRASYRSADGADVERMIQDDAVQAMRPLQNLAVIRDQDEWRVVVPRAHPRQDGEPLNPRQGLLANDEIESELERRDEGRRQQLQQLTGIADLYDFVTV